MSPKIVFKQLNAVVKLKRFSLAMAKKKIKDRPLKGIAAANILQMECLEQKRVPESSAIKKMRKAHLAKLVRKKVMKKFLFKKLQQTLNRVIKHGIIIKSGKVTQDYYGNDIRVQDNIERTNSSPKHAEYVFIIETIY